MTRFVTAAAVLLLLAPALAHDRFGSPNWIADGHYRSPIDGSHCCGEADCVEVPAAMVREVAGGWAVTGHLTYPGTAAAGSVTDDVDEIVPHAEAHTSRDGAYWRCKRPDGSRRCFFAPPGAV